MPSISRRDFPAGTGIGFTTALGGCLGDSCKTRVPTPSNWRQTDHDAQHTNADTDLTPVSPGGVHWKEKLGAKGKFRTSGIAVARSHVVVGGWKLREHGFVRRYSLPDGKRVGAFGVSTRVLDTPAGIPVGHGFVYSPSSNMVAAYTSCRD